MSADSVPITPARFAAALKDLPLSSLHLKLAELRNSIVHLDYSNEQLRPYAEGKATVMSTTTTTSQPQQPPYPPDQDCIDAIRENEEVIERMQERIRLVRVEVEARGLNWDEFQSFGGGGGDRARKEEEEEEEAEIEKVGGGEEQEAGREGVGNNDEEEEGSHQSRAMVNGGDGGRVNGEDGGSGSGSGSNSASAPRHPAWSDGTFQTGVIRDGAVHMDAVAGSRRRGQPGGSLTDEELRRRMEEQLRSLEDDDGDDGQGGLHL